MLKCPKCKSPVDLEKISFKDECPSCGADLHVCIYCTHYDEGKPNRCREPQADYVRERDRANFCEYFRLHAQDKTGSSGRDAAEKLWSQLFKKK